MQPQQSTTTTSNTSTNFPSANRAIALGVTQPRMLARASFSTMPQRLNAATAASPDATVKRPISNSGSRVPGLFRRLASTGRGRVYLVGGFLALGILDYELWTTFSPMFLNRSGGEGRPSL